MAIKQNLSEILPPVKAFFTRQLILHIRKPVNNSIASQILEKRGFPSWRRKKNWSLFASP
jgi:hypothetical protein